MTQHSMVSMTGLLLSLCLLSSGDSIAATDQPDCASLQQWAATLSKDASFEPRAGIRVNRLFEDERVIPLFGKPLVAWERQDISLAQARLADCRRQAMKAKNRGAGDALYAALKELKLASRSLRTIWSARRVVEQRVAGLLKLRPSPELPEILSIAQAALRHEAVNDRVSSLAPQWQGYGRQAAQLGEYSGMLETGEIDRWIAQLEERRTVVATSAAEASQAHESLLAEIAAVPLSQAGLAQLNRIAYRADPGAMTREEQESYNRAFQAKRRQIQQQAATEQARRQRDMATLDAPVRQQVAAVLQGSTVKDASLRGLRPGVGYGEIQAAASRTWGYAEALSLGGRQDKQLSTKRREFDRLKREERRDGGLLNLRTRKGVVGELAYVEHFTGPMNVAPLRVDLESRFGKPDEVRQYGDGSQSMTWHDGDSHLRVRAGNRVTQDRQFMGVRSSVEIALWTQDFADYLSAAEQRCEKLRDKPMSKLSINEKQAIMMGCLTP